MITLDEELENIKNDTTKIGTKPPRIQTLSDVKNSTYGTDSEVKQLISDVESDISNVLGSAVFERGVQNLKNLPEQLQIYGGQALMSLGGFVDSDKTVSMGKELIKSARGELQADEKKFWESSTPLSEKDMESFTYGLGLGIANYGSMLAIGYLNPVAGITLGSAVEIGQQAEEKIGYHIEETGDTELNKYTSQKAQKDTLYTTIYGVGSAIIEKKFGLGKQLKLVKMPITSKLKHVIETAVSEGGTETLQELYATGLDWQGGYIDSSKLPERFMDALKEGVIGAVLGGGLGVASAVNHRSQAKAILRDSLKNTVPEKDLDNVVDGIYESANDSMSTVVAQELIQSESLRNKHGAIYESIKSEVSKQIKNTGAFADVDEMKLSQYIESTAKMFADQVLGEANKRKVVIDDVLKDSEIIYKDGRLYLQGKIEKPKVIRKPRQYNPEKMELLTYLKYKGGLKDVGGELKSMDAGRQIIGLINNKNGRSLDDAMLDAWESGYFPQFSERPTVNDLLNAIDDSLRGNKIYRESFRSTIEQRQAKEKEIENEEQLNMFLSDFISEEDLDTMSLQDKQRFYDDINEQANAVSEDDYIQQEIDSLTDAEAERYAIMTENGATHDEAMQEIESNRTLDEDIPLFFQESFDIADENARLDNIYPEYKGKTININGQEKTVYNSTGERIAKSKEALQNFYKWFGDSKVVDEQGRPLVVYHGSHSDFDTFSKDYIGKGRGKIWGDGFYFTSDRKHAESIALGFFGKGKEAYLYPVYLNIKNPLVDGKMGVIPDEYDGRIQHGAGLTKQEHYYVVKEPNQIKAIDNRGTYSESDNIYYQMSYYDGLGSSKSVSDVKKLLKGLQPEEEVRLMFDKNKGYWFAIDAKDNIHQDMIVKAFEQGMYPEFRNSQEAVQYFDENYNADDEYLIRFKADSFIDDNDLQRLLDENIPSDEYKYGYSVKNADGSGYVLFARSLWDLADTPLKSISKEAEIWERNPYKMTEFQNVEQKQLENNGIFNQSAFHGTPFPELEGGSFKLEKIGTGENAQAHGYGLYYTASYDIADKRYRERLTKPYTWFISFGEVEYDKKSGKYKNAFNEKTLEFEVYKDFKLDANEDYDTLIKSYEQIKGFVDNTEEKIKIAKKYKEYFINGDIHNFSDESMATGQVYEVDLPENPYLLDEQKTFAEQSDFVKQQLMIVWDNLVIDDAKIVNLTGSKTNPYKNVARHKTGKEIYKDLANILGSDKVASELLEKNGIKGITYDGRQDGRCFVIFNPDDVKVIQKFYQKNKKQNKIKGAFDKLTKSIEITSEADFSTYQHEFAHFWLDNIWNYANSGMASEKYIKEFESIKKWLGVKGNYPTRSQHEKFARAYEKYLYKGTNADAPIGQAFKDYENFIREVYSSIAEIDTRAGLKKYRAVPKLVYDFFNDMTSGTLPFYGDIEEPEKEVKKEVKEVKEFVAEETKILEENRANYNLKPVQTDTKTGYLTAYEKMTGEKVEAGSIELKEQMEKAESFVANNPEQAERIVNGLEQAPEGIVKNAVYVAYNNLQKKLGNTDKRVNSMLNQALELRRMGQEIASQRLAYTDEASALYWIRKVQESKIEALADASGLKVSELSEKINSSIKAGMKDGKSAKDIAKELRNELGVTELFQEEVYPTNETDVASYNYIYKYVNEQLGLSMSMDEAETITRKADDMLASLQNSMSETGNPSVDFFVKQKDIENYANSLAPSSNARVIVSVIGRGNLLTSIKSPITNIISNFFVGAYRGAVRRVNLGVANSIVSPELIKENKMYSWEIFRKTGYNVNNITPETPRNTILGEKLTHSEGEGNIRKLGRLYEEYIYKWSLGAGDVLFKDYAFTDYVALKATKLANGDVNKANELFKDASLIEPQTDEGKQIRQEAIDESLIATFQNKGAISEGALKARASIDFGVGFGEIIAPFVKTPANIVSMGLKAGFGGVRAIASEIKRDVKAGKILKPTQENIDLVVQNGLGLLLASMLINAIDDDDYMPPYAIATAKDKQLAKELNIPFNAVKIGNTWISLDYLGALASPIVGLLQARREEGVLNTIYGYSKSAGVQSLSIPAFGNISDLFEKVQNLVRKSGDEVMSETGQDLLEQAYARVVPSIVSDVAKALDTYERETQGNEFITKIPVLRETAPKKVSVTSGVAEELGSPVYDILFGSRVKEQVTNDVADELQRLNNAGWGVSLTTVTRSGLLSELDEDTKQKVREDFAVEYSKQVKRLIKGAKYKRSSDEDKQEMINKIRRDIISGLKRRYLKKKKQ